MTRGNASIKIPEDGAISSLTPYQKRTEEKFRHFDTLIYAIVAAVLITAISALIAVGAIVIDQLHFNNQTYRDQSTQTREFFLQQQQINELQAEIKVLQMEIRHNSEDSSSGRIVD